VNDFKPATLEDSLFTFEAGSNRGIAPLLLPKNQLAAAINTTVRGSFATHRATVRKINVSFSNVGVQTAIESGLWQGADRYQPDNGSESLVAMISGRLFQFTPAILTPDSTAWEIPIAGGPNPADRTQAWLWQSEKWTIINDGLSIPIFFDGTTARRSNVGAGELPPGRMGAYGMGRNWFSLVDGKQFEGSDIVNSSSGTIGNNFRDAVLKVTQNTFLAGGGKFTVPGTMGEITAMKFVANLDASLGQGPLHVFTYSTIFSCNAPVDNLTWQDITNPILTETLISNGALAQNSTVIANSDVIFRSLDGIRSEILGRRDFNTWGNVPQSNEVRPVLDQDSPDLLRYSSAVVFDNRYLITALPTPSDQGVYHKKLIALNFDTISSLRGKAPSVYDDVWVGLNVLQLVTGQFNRVERCFAFCLNTITNTIDLYEILKSGKAIYDVDDFGNQRIIWEGESPVLFNYPDGDPRKHQLKRLQDGEIYVDDLIGKVDFQVWYKPEESRCWIPWFKWQECAPEVSETNPYAKPQFRPRMGLGEPSPAPCDETTNRPFREGYNFQIKWIITGHCRFLGGRVRAITCPEPSYAPQNCTPQCP